MYDNYTSMNKNQMINNAKFILKKYYGYENFLERVNWRL